jgi:hypothetical protein
MKAILTRRHAGAGDHDGWGGGAWRKRKCDAADVQGSRQRQVSGGELSPPLIVTACSTCWPHGVLRE